MSIEITMPKLSDTMEEGKILRWLKHPGDRVKHGEPIAEVETDKADMVMEAFDEGVMEEILLGEGDSAPVGAVIAKLLAPGEAATKAPPSAGAKPAAAPSEQPRLTPVKKRAPEESVARPENGDGAGPSGVAPIPPPQATDAHPEVAVGEPVSSARPASAPSAPGKSAATAAPMREARALRPAPHQLRPDAAQADADASKFKASPLARRAAEEAGVDLSHVHGTGPDGRITKRDIDNFLRQQQLFRQRRLVTPREGAPGSWEELSKMRKTIAQRMAASKREIPHFYVTMEVDMEESVRLKKSLETTELFDEAVTFNDIVIKACALALGRFPRMNASYDNDGIRIHSSINIGMAVAVEDGLILPVIKECQQLTLPEIARMSHRLITKAAQGGFVAEELSGATFSISNMGMLGIEHFSAVIVPPQAAILAVSAIKERPVVRNGQLAVGTTMMLTVSCDHRIVDGVVAGRFLQEMKRFLENPASLLI